MKYMFRKIYFLIPIFFVVAINPYLRPFGGFIASSPLLPTCSTSPINSPFVIKPSAGIFGPFMTLNSDINKTLTEGTPILGWYDIRPSEDCVVESPTPIPVSPYTVGPSPVFSLPLFGIGRYSL